MDHFERPRSGGGWKVRAVSYGPSAATHVLMLRVVAEGIEEARGVRRLRGVGYGRNLLSSCAADDRRTAAITGAVVEALRAADKLHASVLAADALGMAIRTGGKEGPGQGPGQVSRGVAAQAFAANDAAGRATGGARGGPPCTLARPVGEAGLAGPRGSGRCAGHICPSSSNVTAQRVWCGAAVIYGGRAHIDHPAGRTYRNW
jgi:hypothetical protein